MVSYYQATATATTCSRRDVAGGSGGADRSIKGCIVLFLCGFNYQAAHELILSFFFFYKIRFEEPMRIRLM